MTDEKFECEKCGETFDSERGLHIHESRSHTETETSGGSIPTVSLSVWKFGTLMFALGLTTGIIAGGFAVGVGMNDLTAESLNMEADNPVENTDTGTNNQQNNNDNSDRGVVSLENPEYPYGDLEAGVGDGERTKGNTTFELKGEPYIGSPDAGVTAVSFEDFECPFCKSYSDNAYPQIVENYVRTGDVQYFYKHLPLPEIGHAWAEPSALASECALNQDAEAFWTFKQGFFDNQEALGNAHQSGNFDESMYKWAEQTGLDTEQFKQCYDNEEEMEEVQNDKKQAGTIGAQATPTIFINDQKVEGAQPYSRFESTIESQIQ
jgi:protein-disulfide isomerase